MLIQKWFVDSNKWYDRFKNGNVDQQWTFCPILKNGMFRFKKQCPSIRAVLRLGLITSYFFTSTNPASLLCGVFFPNEFVGGPNAMFQFPGLRAEWYSY